MEDTGELVHILNSDLHHTLSYEADDDRGSDLDLGGGIRKKRVNQVIDQEDDEGSDLDNGGSRERRVNLEGDETESDLDQSVSRMIPGKKCGKMGIMRRKGVNKSKGSPYRGSGSSHDEDFGNPLVPGYQTLERRNGEGGPAISVNR